MKRDKIVCGINGVSIRNKLLSESELIFKKAFKFAQGIEAAHRYVSGIGDRNLTSDGKEGVWYTNRNVGNDPTPQKTADNHGVSHAIVVRKTTKRKSVRIRKNKCYRFLKTVHLIRCCRSKKKNELKWLYTTKWKEIYTAKGRL